MRDKLLPPTNWGANHDSSGNTDYALRYYLYDIAISLREFFTTRETFPPDFFDPSAPGENYEYDLDEWWCGNPEPHTRHGDCNGISSTQARAKTMGIPMPDEIMMLGQEIITLEPTPENISEDPRVLSFGEAGAEIQRLRTRMVEIQEGLIKGKE